MQVVPSSRPRRPSDRIVQNGATLPISPFLYRSSAFATLKISCRKTFFAAFSGCSLSLNQLAIDSIVVSSSFLILRPNFWTVTHCFSRGSASIRKMWTRSRILSIAMLDLGSLDSTTVEPTRFWKMVWLLMPDRTLAFRIRPPWRGLGIALGVGVVGLLLGLDELDKTLADYLTGGLLHGLEAGNVELFDLSLITNV